jgi:hypothetical protein
LIVDNQVTAASPGYTLAGAAQCVPVLPAATYDFAVQAAIPSGQSGSGTAIGYFFFYASSDCSGDIDGVASSTSLPSSGTCQALSASVLVPASAHSVKVRLLASKPFSQPSLKVEFDNVLFKRH